MEDKDWIAIILTVWANTVSTIALILTLKKDKRPSNPRKNNGRKRKR